MNSKGIDDTTISSFVYGMQPPTDIGSPVENPALTFGTGIVGHSNCGASRVIIQAASAIAHADVALGAQVSQSPGLGLSAYQNFPGTGGQQ